MTPYIEVRRPFSLLLILGLVYLFLSTAMQGGQESSVIEGAGGDEPPTLVIHTAEDEIRRAKLEHELAKRHIAVLKFQLNRLEAERALMQEDLTAELNEQYRAGLRNLVELIEGKRRADDKMIESFQQMWDAERAAKAAAALGQDDPDIQISWPIEPVYGISAIFEDPEYEKFFGIPHKAVDVPALQGTPVLAAAAGVIEDVVDNGMGYSYLTVRHNGYATRYGHMSQFDVAVGQQVAKGQQIGLSGGMPGTKGAGNLTTGPHLHFEVVTGKGHVNPLKYLPASGVKLRE